MSTLGCDPSQQPRSAGLRMDPADGADVDSDSGGVEYRWRGRESERSFLSVVVAARNEAASLPQLIDEIATALRPLCDESLGCGLTGFEVIVVDDASTDGTASVLKELAAVYPELKGFVLACGAGQSPATVAGIRAAQGNWIATLDADLQNDPADLPRLWKALTGHDAAVGWRVNRQDVWSKRLISWWANRVRNLVLGQSIRDTGCSLRIFRRETALRLPMFRGVHRFFGPLLLREGCRVVQVPVHDRPRLYGRSHYGLWSRTLQVVIDLFGVAWLLRRPVYCRALAAWESEWDAGLVESNAGVPAGDRWKEED